MYCSVRGSTVANYTGLVELGPNITCSVPTLKVLDSKGSSSTGLLLPMPHVDAKKQMRTTLCNTEMIP